MAAMRTGSNTRMARTSTSHPLQIGSIPIGNGLIGVTLCPGKKGDSVFGAPWDRDLGTDLEAIAAWGASCVLTLIEAHEMPMLGVSGLPEAIRATGPACHHLPIRDVDVPGEAFMAAWREIAPLLQQDLDRGRRILVHCRGGLGRAGTVAALLLIERGIAPRAAIARVREARPGAIETRAQENWLLKQGEYASNQQRLIHASLLGGALGDSLGAEIEFKTLRAVRALYPDGVRELPEHDGRVGAITDDTQMTLFTAEGLIQAYGGGALKGACHPPSIVHQALLRWYTTQSRGRASTPVKIDSENGLVADCRLHVARAPGNTCLSALGQARSFGEPARNDSKGCGTIMRVAPIGLGVPRDQVRQLAARD